MAFEETKVHIKTACVIKPLVKARTNPGRTFKEGES